MENSTPCSLMYHKYFERYAFGEAILPPPEFNKRLIITIPAFNEPRLKRVLSSVRDSKTSEFVQVLVLLNYPENASSEIIQFHQSQFAEIKQWAVEHSAPDLIFTILIQALPAKTAGVGLARKILMDEAARQLTPEGVIVALDADCIVETNYLSAIGKYFDNNPAINAASIHYEHPLNAQWDASLPARVFKAIIPYELHLRYYVEAQRFAGTPYAFHTVGSAMSVRASTYCKAGGMNKRKAGEDFYFIQKLIPHGYGEITDTTVIPSPRQSNRVPFGTGKAVNEILQDFRSETYAFENILIVKEWLKYANEKWNKELNTNTLNPLLKKLIEAENYLYEWERIQHLSPNYVIWRRHFFEWYNGFTFMKALHYLRAAHLPDQPVVKVAGELMEKLTGRTISSPTGLLTAYRQRQKLLNHL